MGAFTLDTSGAVSIPNADPYGPSVIVYTWTSLDAFTHGYSEAALRAANEIVWPGLRSAGPLDVRFSDLAPETIALILKDCARYEEGAREVGLWSNIADVGEQFWRVRQSGAFPGFPPLTVSLGDDGKVYLREAS